MKLALQSSLLLPTLRYALVRLGWAFAAALGLLAAAALVHYFGVVVPEAEIARLRAAGAEEFARRKAIVAAPDVKTHDALRTANFVQQLPDATQALQSIEAIHLAAARHGVALPSAQYQVSAVARDTAGGFKKTTIVMPVRATYPALRAWLTDVLNQQAAIALDELSLQRANADTDMLEARVRLTLFVADGK
jgi:hypothetical protein